MRSQLFVIRQVDNQRIFMVGVSSDDTYQTIPAVCNKSNHSDLKVAIFFGEPDLENIHFQSLNPLSDNYFVISAAQSVSQLVRQIENILQVIGDLQIYAASVSTATNTHRLATQVTEDVVGLVLRAVGVK